MKLIVGLGNPGKEYEKTYHNIGFLTLDALCAALGGKWNKKYGNAIVCEVKVGQEKIILAKPQTFMNLSGQSVVQIKNKFKIDTKDILVILDDVDLPKGSIRFRQSGSAGTHNGLKNIVQLLGTQDFARLRIGIDKPQSNMDLADYVLSKINDNHMQIVQQSILEAVDFILYNFIGAHSAN
jgi:PTH1 family peptidyl-tRNA hydrolase